MRSERLPEHSRAELDRNGCKNGRETTELPE
jgi:hypothetical protein